MKHSIRFAGVALAVAAATVAAVSKVPKHLTPQRVAELNALSDAAKPGHVTVEISGISRVKIVPDSPAAVMELIREYRFPTEFSPPEAQRAGDHTLGAPDGYPVTPTTPRAFETLHTGWTISLTTKALGGLIEVYGEANYVEVDLVKGGYGALSGPILRDDGVLITPNKLDLPKSHTTTTRFHVFAVPGESYDVTFYKGSKVEKHTVSVTAE